MLWKILTIVSTVAVFSLLYTRLGYLKYSKNDEEVLKFRRTRFSSYQESESKRSGPGENGKPVYLEGKEKELADSLFEKEAFNRLASDKIALDRSIPDVRDSKYVFSSFCCCLLTAGDITAIDIFSD